MNKLSCAVLLLTAVLFGCNSGANEYEIALLDIFKKEKELDCKLSFMRDSINIEWNSVNELIEQNLPSDMPNEEKVNMLKVRNANLIRMFQTYDSLDDETKSALMKTEQFDQAMANRITKLKTEINAVDSQKIALFKKLLQNNNAELVDKYKNINATISSRSCE